MEIDESKYTLEKKGNQLIFTEIEEKVWPQNGDKCFLPDIPYGVAKFSWTGDETDSTLRDYHMLYRTPKQAEKAGKLLLRSAAIIKACIEVDPDFEPDWSDEDQDKWAIGVHVAHVSTEEKAKQACALLKKWGIK